MAKGHWWVGKKNFGDLLTPLLFKKFLGITIERSASMSEADLVCVGSILDLVPKGWGGIVLGSGILKPTSKVDLSAAKCLAVRGPLTHATAVGVPKDVVYGDLGLLADELIPRPAKLHALGLVPHWSDKTLETRPEFLKYKPLIIRVSDDPLEVIRQIGSCRKIVSSSLHGVILADAFRIPRRTEMTPQFDKEGGSFKFRDYAESIGAEFKVGETQEPSARAVTARQHELYDVLLEAGKFLKQERKT